MPGSKSLINATTSEAIATPSAMNPPGSWSTNMGHTSSTLLTTMSGNTSTVSESSGLSLIVSKPRTSAGSFHSRSISTRSISSSEPPFPPQRPAPSSPNAPIHPSKRQRISRSRRSNSSGANSTKPSSTDIPKNIGAANRANFLPRSSNAFRCVLTTTTTTTAPVTKPSRPKATVPSFNESSTTQASTSP